jgi:hypothetical protein
MKSWTRILSPLYWLELFLSSAVAVLAIMFKRP